MELKTFAEIPQINVHNTFIRESEFFVGLVASGEIKTGVIWSV